MPAVADPALPEAIAPTRAAAEYWKTTLSGAPELLELPTDHARPARQDHAGASVEVELDEELSAGLEALSRRHGATPYMTLLAGWAVVLSRLSGQEDVVIGTPAAGRGRRETEGPNGFASNTLAIRVDLSGAPTVAELLERVKERALGAQHHQDIPFQQVVELVQPARSLAHTPLFQVMFAWQNASEGRPEVPALRLGGVGSSSQATAKFDLSLTLSERDGRIVGGLTYATALFEQATVERWLGYLRAVLRAMAADDARAVDRLELLSEDERRRVVEEWNHTEADYPRELCIHQLFEAQAARTPDAVAIVYERERVTYAELNARANQLAHWLRALGVGPDRRVAICVDRGVEMMVGLLAIMKAGGAYVPLDPAYPAERLEYMLADSAPVVLLTQGSLAGLFDGTDVRGIDLVADAGTWAGQPETNPGRPGIGLTPDHLAYVIYTSGSTGQPKGVMVEHRSLANLVAWHCAAFGVKVGDRSSSVAGFGFDATTWEVWPPLCAGAALMLPATRDPQALLEWWEEQTLDVSFLPTPLAEVAFACGRASAGLRTLLIGGDRLRSIPAEPLPFTLVNNYGPTETTVVATSGEIGASAKVHIGRPIANTRVYLLDRAGEPVPEGVAGELYIGGAGVARGYQHRPGLTAERFVPDPFAGAAGARLYRTGDLARWLADGTLEFLGRTDLQVKIRGFRIEPGEIESRLSEHPAVRDAVVLVRQDASGDRRLVAYYVGEALDVETLRAHLSERLPEYMVPAAYVRLATLPLTPNGKVDRKALPAPEGDAFPARAYEAPASEAERAVAEIWSELLGVERVGRRDHFFELGGDSLLAVRVVSRVRQALGVEASSRDVFERPVLADFARGLKTAARAEAAAIERVDRTGNVPLSFAQQRLWFMEQLGGTGAAYHVTMRLRLRGSLDRGALVRALDRIVARHEALRTVFAVVDGEPQQRIVPADEHGFILLDHDLSGCGDAERELLRLAEEEAAAPFNLAVGPLVRGRLARMAPEDHALLLTMHHVVSDGWSIGVLKRELGELYTAFARGEPDPLPPLPVQYADYTAWYRRRVEGPVLEAQAEYWTRTLAGAPELLELPADRPRPPRQDFAGALLQIELDEALTAALKALGQRHGATLYMTLLAGWAVVLARLSGQDDVVVGTPSAGRGSSEIEGLIGFFVNTLAVRVDVSGSPTVAELLGRVRERALEAQRHQDFPFEQVVERVGPARSLSYTPLFQVMLAWQEMLGGELELPGIAAAPLDGVEEGGAPFDLTLSLTPRGGRITGTLTYATALFDRTTVERHVGYLRRALEAMAADESQAVDRLPLLPETERRLVVEAWNDTDSGYPRGACVHELFAAQAARTPEAVALSWRGERLTYAQLEARANQLANALRRRGVGPEVRVGICLPRTPDLVAAMLGVLKAGGAYVPLDPAYPRERLGYMLEDAGVTLVITDSELADRLPHGVAALLLLDRERDAIAAESAAAPESGAGPENLSHVIFTSGSTGRPKGVMIRHSSVVVLLHWLRENVTDEERSSVLFSTSINFDVSIAEVFGTLAWGGKLVIAENALELATLGEEVVYASMVPSAAAELLRSGGIPACVKTLNLGGEALPNALAQGLYALETVEKVGNLYGPTEDTTYSTYHLVPRGADQVLVGTPVANTRAYVLDPQLQPVPAGVAGELYLAGDGLSRGYANRPAMTAERFVPCPFGAPGARMYRVMDRVRWRESAEVRECVSAGVDSVPANSRTDALTHSRTAVLEYLGRTDFQVKVRGYRIELGEIEARLAEHPGVRAPVVLVREDVPGDRRLVAYYLADEPVAVDALKSHLADRLPGYMVPAAYVWMEAYPLTPNGKTDRRALPAPGIDAYAAREYEAPVGETEQAVAAIWAQVLGAERVGRRDNFFELGGHSLLAMQVISRVREALGAEVPLQELFERPVLADSARGLETAARAEATAIAPVDRTAAIPLSFPQRQLWLLEQLGGTGTAYHIPMRLRLRGALDRGALVRALDRIVARHEALRTTFPAVDGEPVQRIAPVEESAFRLVEHDLHAAPDSEDRLRRLVSDEASAPFDLEHGPLIRGRLVRMAANDHVLLLTMHHIVSDGWSLGVLRLELGALYAAFARGQADPLPPLPVQYADYAVWHRRWLSSHDVEAQAEYWTRTLAGAPELLELPADRPRPPRQDFAGALLRIELDETLTAALKALGQRHGTTLYMTLMAGWAVVLARLSGQDDVVVGTPSAGRGSSRIEGLIGFFGNPLAVRVDVSGSPTVAELLRRVRERALEAQRHQDLPFEQVVERVRPARSLSHTPLFQAMLAWQEMPGGDELELPGIAAAPLDGVEEGGAPFDLTLSIAPRGGRIAGTLAYATALFDRATVERHVGYLRRVLEAMAADEDQAVDRLDLLDAAERRRVVEEWNATDAGYPAGACVHDLFRAQAARTPEAVALSWQGERLTYAQLEARANGLANALRRRGVGPEVRVGICLPRTPDLVAAMLGVLKAGGAYVPLDPAYPRERLSYMLEDAGVTLVITDSDLADRLPASEAALLLLDRERDAIAAESAAAPESGAGPENLSHVIFTSGSTGRPKGVMIRHASTVVLLHWLRENVTDEERSSVLFSTSINFDVSVAEVFGTLAWGGKLVLVENALELATLGEEVVYASMVPSAAAELLRSGGIPACVKTLNLGGEALPNALAQGLYALETVEKVGNLYGPTEDTTYSTYHLVPRGADEVLIGTPVSNTQAYVLDHHLQPVPVGAVGELYLAGDGLSRGYANHPAMTAERFVPCPFGAPGARMYRVMDRVRRRTDGELEYLGRTDFQVKVRGYRIELGEIEARLAEHPGVRAPVVLVREDAPGDRRLVAYYLADEPAAVDALKSHLADRLPGYMVPAAYVWMEAYPLTPNGKVDRKAFPAPEGGAYAVREYEAPVGETEQAVAAIWAEVLGAERVGRGDNFFELGGHSLMAVRVGSRVRQALGVEALPGDLFERPVLADFARGLETAARAEATAIAPVDRTAAIPPSFAQQRMWFLEQLDGTGAAYHIPMRLRLRGALDHGALVRALDRIVARHEALRTSFPTVDGEPVQRIAPVEESAFRLVEHDLHAAPDAEDELRRLVQDEASAPFDLAQGPLFRGRLVRMAADDHVLLLTMHHIVSDGWSLGVLHRELGALYAAFARGEPDPLPPLPVQYADYAVWHRHLVEGPVLEAQAEYWRETLAGAPELLELPADHPRPARQDFAGASLKVELDEALTAALKTLGQRHGATLHMTLLAGWAAVLARLSGQDEVVVGTPSANRGRSEIEGLIGFFVNTLALRVDVSGSPSVAELLGRVKERSLGAQHHQDIPFEQVVELVQPVRSLTHAPLIQVMFAWQNAPGESLELPGLALGPLDPAGSGGSSSPVTTEFDLSLALWEDGGRIEGAVEYATALFEQGTVERWLGYLRRVLEGMVADERGRVERLELLPDAERWRVVEEFNGRWVQDPREAFVHEQFEAQVERTPGAAALVFEDATLSYAELNARANRLAHHLRALGVGPDVRVALCMERGPGMVVGVLAVLKAGGAYLPLDPAYPGERLRYMLEDGAPAALLTEAALRPLFADATLPVLELDAAEPAWASLPATDLGRGGLTPDHLAYVIYTSGSTGLPKGVRVPHGSLGATLAVAGEAFGFGAGDRVPSLASFAFDIWLFETLLPLLGGGTVRLVPRERVPDVPRLVEDLAWCTALHAVPALMRRIVEEVRATSEGVLGTLRHAFVGGDAVAPDLLEEMRAAFPAAEIHVLYGPTEGAIICAAHRLGGEAAARQMVGRPLGNAALYVVEPGGRVAPVGVPGELCLGGASVARDYLGRPGLTAERFVPDPFASEPGARLYRTGDRVRWLADGSVEFLGRTDHQVKVRGFRIEPGEIEARLAEHAGVREAVVLVREDTPGEKRLVAYVAGDEAAGADVLRAHLSARLPEYMVPAAYVRLEALPLTPNGKVDRKALPAPDADAFTARGYEAPSGTVEEAVAAIWAELLGAERVGRRDHFFELGGHSLLATRVVSRMRELFGMELPLRALFEGPTVAELAGRVEEIRRAGEGAALPPLVPVAREAPLPLSFAQERLWFLQQMEPEGVGYNMPWPRRLRGRLDAGALERALGELVRRHEALRTTFRPLEQGAVQIVHPAEPARLPVLDLTGLAPQAREHEARRLAQEDAERPFDLKRGPLLRATLVRLSDEEHVLLLNMHHIVSDGWSMGVLVRELFTLYEALSLPSGAEGPASPLPPLAVQYADFAVWQRGWLRGEVLQRQLDWWRERLGGAPPALELPTDRPRPAVASSRGASLMFRLPADVTRGLRSLARREGATLYMVTHAALDLLLSRWSGQEDLVVGSPIAGRTQVGTEGLIGFFVNTLALRIDLSGDPSFQELVRRVRETALGAYAHQDLPFERLVEEVAPDRGLSHTPLFQVMFALQNANSGERPAIAGLRLEPFESDIRTVRFGLELDLTEVGEELVGSLRFGTDLFDAATMERFAAQYRVVLDAAVASPEEPLSRLAILPPEEARTLLAYGSGPARGDAGGVPVHHLFAAQAARTPGAPAVLFAGESLTYAELNARAERLARELRRRGVRAGTTVAVCLQRDPGVLVAPLAVWKAGGVYLPLDPAHPAERLSFLLADSGAELVVTEPALAGVLPEREVEVVLLDGITAPRDREGADEGGAAAAEVLPGDLAYLIYTSGSTGTPKAVMVEHAQLTHTLRASLETLGFGPDDVVAALASTSFDISLLELVTPLLAGGAVRIVPHEVARDPETLVEAAADVRVLHAVPALMRQVVEVVRGGRTLPGIRLLLVGGDTVPPDLLEDMRTLFPAAQTRVLYGPTEGTIICATYAVPAEGAVAGHPLGRPLPGVRLAIRGPRGEMAPVGVPGEVWISGGGVGRGYLDRPELNAEKFVGAGAERAYRTGDRARWRTDGVLEFLGRADEQVKVRGFRIEPGEVEAVLRDQPGVREAVVLAREDAPGDRRLVAYVVPGTDGVGTAAGTEQVSEWETLFDDTYAQDEGEEDPTLQLKGWNSSYTGEPIPREEMREWVEHTAERILALRPERVLEVGCGTGLLLFRVAPHTKAYHGTDFSGVALEHVRRHAAGLPQVSLSVREADRLDDYAGAGFDLVVVNSVAQYFPDLDYLLRVLEGAAAAVRPGGRIFVGDVRSLPLLGAFHASVELARAPDDLPAGRLQARVRRGMAEEQELLLDPVLFDAVRARIHRLDRVEVQAKRGEYDNEVSRFRYDVVLHLDADIADAADPVVREWSGEDADGLRALAEGSASALLVRGVPDARVREHVRAYELVSAGGEAASAAAVRARAARDAGGIAPEALFALADELARGIEVRPGASGTLDVLFHPAGGVSSFPAHQDEVQSWEVYANDPQWGRRMRALVPALREAARARLPEYMVPGAFVVLEAFPVTANGKVDRGALPAPDTPGSRGTYVAPRTPAEERMAGIWAEVLGVERVGAEDHFFELGGHSLLATQLVSRVREAFRTELPLRAVFEAPTLAELVVRVQALRAETPGDSGAPPLVPVPRDGSPLPLSFAQQRLWFLAQLGTASAAYHMAWQVRLRGELDRGALGRALERIVARHESLRTTLPAVDGEPEQRIAPADEHGFTLLDHDFTGRADAEGELRRLALEEAEAPFDLAVGPLVRGRLVRMGAEDHALLLTMHHVVSDGWSIGVVHRELGALYAAFARGEPDPLPPLPVQYADYAAWQRRRLAGAALEAQGEYWSETLAGTPELLELPADRPRPARQDFTGASVEVELDPELTAALKALGQRNGATLFMTVLAGWAVVLARLSGQHDVVVGTPSAGRGSGEIEGLIGFFVNTLALRVDLSGAPSVAQLLGRVRERALEAQRNQDLPFEQVVERVRPARSLAHTPIFQAMLGWQELPGGEMELPGVAAAPLDGTEGRPAAFDLSLDLAPRGGGISGEVTYATALFDRVTVERYVGYLRRVLEEMAADDAKPVDRLELLSAAERRRVVEEFNAGRLMDPREAFVQEWFEAQVERTPGAAALVFEDETLSYAELNARANRLAHHLRALGVGPDARVGICVERGPGMVVGVLAVLKAGGAYLPLDPAYPGERLRYMLEDGAPAALLTEPALRPLFAGATLPVVELGAPAPAWASLPATNPGRGRLTADHLAYVIYTSGSTGRPKGVRVSHGSLGATLAVAGEAFGLGAGDRVPSLASFAFDIWLFEALLPLLGGGTVRLVPRDRVPDVPRLVEDLAWCTTVHAVPALMRRIVEEVRATPEGVLGTLRHAFVGGDAVAPDLLEEMRAAFPAAEIHVLYGPTEGAIICAAHQLGGEAAARQMVGRPLGNAALYVVEPGGSVAPVGVPGELCLGGASVARDYLGRPGLTAERFVPDPFSAEPGARLYRTGDRVRWLEESAEVRECVSAEVGSGSADSRADAPMHSRTGVLEFLGRTDHQVKVRGFRIEPGEIEARLAEHAGVREAVVLVREDTPGEKRLVAYVAGDETAGAEVLRAHLSERLPEYMVPAAYVRLDALPLTPNGKVDRKALPAPEGDAFPVRGYEAPSGKAEEAVAAIWAELLGAERVGRRDHFFELGGHSLLAVRVVSRVRQALGVEASPGDLFERPVLADFARGLETAARAEAAAIERVDRTGNVPLSFAQQRLWFMEQLGGIGAAYHIPMRLRLRGALDRGALVRSLDRIVARHEALRTSFPAVDGEPVQHIAPVEESGFRLVEHDLHAAPDAEDELRRLMNDEGGAPFDVEAGPLVRGRLVRMAADDHVLLLTMHHIVSDGWSTGVLFRELAALYAAFARGEPDPLPPLPVQYADYAAWHRGWVEGPVLEAQAEYWTETLAGAPELLELPADHPRPAKQDFAGASLNVELDEALTAALKTLSQRHGTTLFMTLLAGWAAVLSRLSGQDDVVVGTASANRGRAEVEELIGFFVNTLPVRVDLSGAPTVAEALGRVKARALEAQQNQDIPFEQVVERVHPTRSLAHSPLFQAMFAWQNAPEGSLELPGLALGPLDPRGSGGSSLQVSAKFDLSLALREEGGRIEGGVDYATALFERETVERWLVYLRRMLEGMVADDSQPVDRLELLPEAERRRVVEEWNQTAVAYPADRGIAALFAERAARTPDAPALLGAGEPVTYGALDERANRLARHLLRRGLAPEARVGICLERGPEMVVALLAALKAGGAYVPLDPRYPAERLAFMLGDAGVAVLVTEERTRGALPVPAGLPVVSIDGARAEIAAERADAPALAAGPRHLAYVIYTSGSTGTPKGVAVEQRSVVRLVRGANYAELGEDEVILQAAPVSFDASTLEIWGALLNGGRLVLVPGSNPSLEGLGQAIAAHGVTTLWLTAGLFEAMARERLDDLAGVRQLLTGGDVLPVDAVARVRARFPALRLINGYGPTENTTFTCCHTVGEAWSGGPVPIGSPVSNTRVYVLDAALYPVPIGVPGELYAGGDGVARGYLGRPALTAERFVPDPFAAEPGARLYRTGDRARWLPDGSVEFLGRTDHQVKIRGFRIEPGEIEARLREHPAVRQAVVLAREDAPGMKRLVAYVVGEAAANALRAHLDACLPAYMVPAAFVPLEALPLTSNGKLDRWALPAPDSAAYARQEPPRTLTERVLAEIWTELLGVERVGRRDHFFDLGGHSLLAVRLVSRVREALNPAATVEDVFAHPTLCDLAALLAGTGEWFGTHHAIPVRETGSERPLFLAHDAQGIVFYGQLLRAHLDAEIPIYALPGPLNDTDEPGSLDDLVTRLVRMITKVQPEGPYRLAGWSAGGIFAYAVAERLVMTGRGVEFVGLLDAVNPAGLPNRDTPRARQFTVLELLARDNGVTPATPEALRALKDDTEGQDLPAFIAACKARGLLPETVTVARAEQVDSRIALLKRAYAEFVPRPLPIPVHLFISDEVAGDPRRGWQDIPGGAPFRLEPVPGTHHTMWKKGNIEVVGATISRAIRESAAGGG